MIRLTSTFFVRVCLLAFVGALVSSSTARAQTTALFLDSQPGDHIGQGVQRTYTSADATFQITPQFSGLSLYVEDHSGAFYWSVRFGGVNSVPLAVGTYEAARQYSAVNPILNIAGSDRMCNGNTGRFVVREVTYGVGNSIVAFAADFEQHCEDLGPGLFGAIRYNSSISDLEPFGGDYPVYQLTVTPPSHGRVTATGVDCGGPATGCLLTLSAPAQLRLTAVPDAGYAFVGWTGGDCSSTATTIWIQVNQSKHCGASFATGVQGSTALFVDSEPGDTFADGLQATYTPLDATFEVTRNYDNSVTVSTRNPGSPSFSWIVNLGAAGDAPLSIGAYNNVRDPSWTQLNSLQLVNNSRFCWNLTGRFIVHEIVYRQDGSVMRLAVDLEAHCDDVDPGFFAAIRYNATFGELTPFGGNYPLYQLTISPSEHGRVTGGGLDCRVGSSPCQLSPVSPTNIPLTAISDGGYLFAGWTGNCRGATTTTVRVNGPKECQAQFEPIISAAPRTLLYWDSQPGDYIGGGKDAVYSSASSQWTVWSASNGRQVFVSVNDGIDSWTLQFSAPAGQVLSPGLYTAARRASSTSFNGLDVFGSGRGCGQLTGRFKILDVALTANGGVERFAADFEQHCEDAASALFGTLRYNSAINDIIPFGGAYPSYQLSIAMPSHGRVSAQGLDCGGQGAQCQLTLGNAGPVTLTAVADFGYVFIGWTEDCSGGTTTTIHVNGSKRCSARFEPAAASTPRTLMLWDGTLGGYFERSETHSLVNSTWAAESAGSNGVVLRIQSVGPTSDLSWVLQFTPPQGDVLQAGRTYVHPSQFPPPAGSALLLISSSKGWCEGGDFTVREIVFGPQNKVVRFAADFRSICGAPYGSLFTGSIQYNSLINVPSTAVTVDPTSLRFASVHNGLSVTQQPLPQVVRLFVSRPDVGWTAVASQPWIQVSPSSGTGSTTLTVALNIFGGHPGTGSASGKVTITLADGTDTSTTLNLTVSLYYSGTTTSPFGVVDSPLEDSRGVTGAIPMTGWLLDDIEVAGVAICRAAVAGEVAPIDPNCAGAAQVFVGNAVFVEGARPDVAAAYPLLPRNSTAGWGFMLLTNMLPNQGNGTFHFYIYGRDREGHTVLVGTRTMTCDNANATAPFGAIDTPAPGETISGSAYVNFGWVLTPNPKVIPTDGSTLMAYIDGQPIGSPSYNHYRSDVSSLFPGLANSAGPVGFRVIDTTTLSDGLHTMYWTATDSAGVASGLGSRFIRVANGGSSSVTTTAAPLMSAPALDALAIDPSPVAGRRGWAPDAAWQHYSSGKNGRAVIRGEEIDRFELALAQQPGETHSGYLRVGTQLRPPPIGSHLDAASGVFTWSPGVGFIGTYDIVFIRSSKGRPIGRREVRFMLLPKGSGHIGAQVVIDAPRNQQDLAQPFVVGGWAADLDAPAGTGIDTLHVWAYPLTGGPPVFLGQAQYGGARPDVAAIHGEQFQDSGFGLAVQGLAHGNYDLAVFAWSTVSGGFVPAQVVRVTVR